MMTPEKDRRPDVILIGIALLSAFLNIYNIWSQQYANAYYTAAVTSMLQSWHNFFYASFDPAGYVTVDKPPVTFWVQAAFAYVFGVRGWSVILPQALAGVGSVLLLYRLVRPTFGKAAARLAGLVMACSPVAVAVSRTNNIDSLLVFTLLLATWLLFRGIGRQKILWVLGAFAMIGVGFNIKMLQAYLVAPAFYLFCLLALKGSWPRKMAVLGAATAVMVAVSLSWAVLVDAIPQAHRPYIGGSKTNSVLELALGYNGISRLTGNRGGMGPGAQGGEGPGRPSAQNDGGAVEGGQPMSREGNTGSDGRQMTQYRINGPGYFAPEGGGPGAAPGTAGGGPQGRGGGGMFGTGQAGPLRLLQSELSGQISWLLPFVAFAGVGLLAGPGRRKPLTARQGETLFWLAWLLPGVAFFSVAGFFHQYYLIMLAPPLAALAGTGWVELFQQYRSRQGWKRWLLPAGLLATTVFQLYVLHPYRDQIGPGWLMGLGAAGIGLSLVLFLSAGRGRPASAAALAAMLVLLAAPLYWASTPILYGDNSMLPQAGPAMQAMGGQGPSGQASPGQAQGMGRGANGGINTRLLAYVTGNNTGQKYLFAATDTNTATPYIIETGKAVMAMGGFSGADPILTVEKLKQMVADNQVKYFLIPAGSGLGGGGGRGDSAVLEWIRANSTEVPGDQWQSDAGQGSATGPGGNKLYQINQSNSKDEM